MCDVANRLSAVNVSYLTLYLITVLQTFRYFNVRKVRSREERKKHKERFQRRQRTVIEGDITFNVESLFNGKRIIKPSDHTISTSAPSCSVHETSTAFVGMKGCGATSLFPPTAPAPAPTTGASTPATSAFDFANIVSQNDDESRNDSDDKSHRPNTSQKKVFFPVGVSGDIPRTPNNDDQDDDDDDEMAEFTSIMAGSAMQKAIILTKQSAAAHATSAAQERKSAADNFEDAEAHDLETTKELEQMQDRQQKLLDLKGRTPSKKVRRKIDGEIRGFDEVCQTVVKAKGGLIESNSRPRPYTEPRNMRQMDPDFVPNDGVHGAQVGEGGGPLGACPKTPRNLF